MANEEKTLVGAVFDPKGKTRKELVDEIMTGVETQKKIIAEERAAAKNAEEGSS